MKETLVKIQNSNFIKVLKEILSSKYFPFLGAALAVTCYYTGLDLLMFYFIATTCALTIVLLDDLSPIFSSLLFMGVTVSLKNTIALGISDYYGRPVIYIQLIIMAVFLILLAVYRLIKTIVQKKFKLTPMFYGTCALAAVLVLNGLFSEDYTPKNLLYGFIIAAAIFGIYAALKDNLKLNSEAFEKIAYAFIAMSALLLVELIVAYATTDINFENDVVNNRNALVFGWGDYNTFGLKLLICIPAAIYLACKKRFGFVYTAYSLLLFTGLFFSCSRQTIIGGVIIYIPCIAMLFINKKNRIANAIVLAVAAAVGILLVGIFHETVFRFLKMLFDSLFSNGKPDGNGRIKLWKDAIKHFKASPFFGSGFFSEYTFITPVTVEFIPMLCHNTILQYLGSCGIIGLTVYFIHRAQTAISFFRKVTIERTFIALTILSFLILDLFDHHLFNVFPTLIYGALLAVLDKSEEKTV